MTTKTSSVPMRMRVDSIHNGFWTWYEISFCIGIGQELARYGIPVRRFSHRTLPVSPHILKSLQRRDAVAADNLTETACSEAKSLPNFVPRPTTVPIGVFCAGVDSSMQSSTTRLRKMSKPRKVPLTFRLPCKWMKRRLSMNCTAEKESATTVEPCNVKADLLQLWLRRPRHGWQESVGGGEGEARAGRKLGFELGCPGSTLPKRNPPYEDLRHG